MTTTRSAPRTTPAPGPVIDGFGPPPPPRAARSVAGALMGVLLIVFCAAGVAVYTAGVGHRHAVVVVARAVKAGAVIQDADLGELRLSADRGLRTVPATQKDRLVGRVAGVNLMVGTLMTPAEIATGPQADADHAIVGLAVKTGQFPGGLHPLDPVLLVDAGPAATGPAGTSPAGVLAGDAQVTSVDLAADGQTTEVSVLVPRRAAAAVAAAAAHGTVSVVLLGGPAPG